jgi:glycosyltransferase involved in cell wall biosynthesis
MIFVGKNAMKKVYVLAPNEDWIVDRFVKEWNEDNSDISVTNPKRADVIWLFADWCFNQIPYELLANKRVITTIHHIVPEKFKTQQLYEFRARDSITSVYHVPNEHTKKFIEPLTTKPIHVIPYWANQKIWKKTSTKFELREKYKIPQDAFVVGSFQRDTEGAGISQGIYQPKLEKGPDLLADYLESVGKIKNNLYVVLAGWRRQYLIERLSAANILHSYIDKPEQIVLNDLYQTLDLYSVSARYEGGPQSLLECGLLDVPMVSRDVGMATQVLCPSAIRNNLTDAVASIPNVEHLKLPAGYQPYRKLIESL